MLGVLFAAELTRPVQEAVVMPWTEALSRFCALLVRAFDSGITSSGRSLIDAATGFGVSIESGCNGVEATLILVAAILAFPGPWRLRLAGIAAGFVAVQALNVVRVVSLFYLGRWNHAAFEWAHLYLWQMLIMVDAVLVWMIWTAVVSRRARRADAR